MPRGRRGRGRLTFQEAETERRAVNVVRDETQYHWRTQTLEELAEAHQLRLRRAVEVELQGFEARQYQRDLQAARRELQDHLREVAIRREATVRDIIDRRQAETNRFDLQARRRGVYNHPPHRRHLKVCVHHCWNRYHMSDCLAGTTNVFQVKCIWLARSLDGAREGEPLTGDEYLVSQGAFQTIRTAIYQDIEELPSQLWGQGRGELQEVSSESSSEEEEARENLPEH